MSKANPTKAMAALLPLEIRVSGYDFTVRPVTLGMYAALERINSPLITGREPEDTLELIPSLYLLTHDPREVLTGNLVADALAWADTVGVDAVAAIRQAAARQLNAGLDVVPEDDEEAPKKKRTAGSPTSSATPRKPTAGAMRKSSGAPPSPRSSSSGARTASRPTKSSRSR